MTENELYTLPSPPADYQTLLMDPCFCIRICRRLLGFTLDVHETLLALTLHAYSFQYLIDFFLFVTALVFRALLSFPVICLLMRYY